MKLLSTIVKLNHRINTGSKDLSNESLLSNLESLILQNPQISDKEACFRIYGHAKTTSTYRTLKLRLQNKVIGNLIENAKSVSQEDSDEEEIKLRQMMFLAQILIKNHHINESIVLIEEIIKLAKAYGLVEGISYFLIILINQYSFIAVNQNKLNRALEDLAYFTNAYNSEILVSKHNASISYYHVKSKGQYDQKTKKKIDQMIQEISLEYHKYPTKNNSYFYFDLLPYHYIENSQYQKALDFGLAALELGLKNSYSKRFLFSCYENIGLAQFHLKQYKEAELSLYTACALPTASGRFWFHIYTQYFMVVIVQEKYDEAYKIFHRIISDKKLEDFSYYQEQWLIREAVMQVLVQTNRIERETLSKYPLRTFSLSKFLNSVHLLSKDKIGQNITILIIQLTFLFLEKRYSEITDKIDALKQYSYRYLKNDDTYRSNCLIKMVTKAYNVNFHPVRTEAHTKDLYLKLISKPNILNEKSACVEIIPFDTIWEIMLGAMRASK